MKYDAINIGIMRHPLAPFSDIFHLKKILTNDYTPCCKIWPLQQISAHHKVYGSVVSSFLTEHCLSYPVLGSDFHLYITFTSDFIYKRFVKGSWIGPQV